MPWYAWISVLAVLINVACWICIIREYKDEFEEIPDDRWQRFCEFENLELDAKGGDNK